ncbi:Fc.00g044920.m01.CDS01 [Cosmosporella sp. VM-42]
MATLSACRLSRSLPQRRLFKVSDTPWLCFRPDAGHEYLSGELYGSAMRKMAWWSLQEFDSQPILALTVLVLFCYLESSMGNFQEFRLHSEAVEKFLESYSDGVIPHDAGLVAAWVEVKMQNWWRRAYFSIPDFHRDYNAPLLNSELQAICLTAQYRRASVLWILCESHRLNATAIVEFWDGRYHDDQIVVPDDFSYSLLEVEPEQPRERLSWSQYVALTKSESEKLDAWHSSLPASDLPEFIESQSNRSTLNPQKLEIQAIHFGSHTSAMNFAYYIAARAMQCTGPIQSLENHSLMDMDCVYGEVESWILILLRIAAGVSWKECIRLNVYTIGLTGLLLACALRSRSLSIGLWIEEWLEEHLTGDEFEEGNFPVFQVLAALRLVNRERRNGLDVFALFQTVNDGGGSGKFGSYHSQLIKSLLVYGRCRTTGQIYSYCSA